MRTAVKVIIVLAVLGALAAGLLGPMVAAGHLHDYANAAARAGYNQMVGSNFASSSVSSSVQNAVTASVAQHPNVTVKSVSIANGTVTVVLQQKVHSFMSGISWLKGWFTVNATESASAFG